MPLIKRLGRRTGTSSSFARDCVLPTWTRLSCVREPSCSLLNYRRIWQSLYKARIVWFLDKLFLCFAACTQNPWNCGNEMQTYGDFINLTVDSIVKGYPHKSGLCSTKCTIVTVMIVNRFLISLKFKYSILQVYVRVSPTIPYVKVEK